MLIKQSALNVLLDFNNVRYGMKSVQFMLKIIANVHVTIDMGGYL